MWRTEVSLIACACLLLCGSSLQVSVSGQALVFVVRTSGWSITSRAGLLTYVAFFAAQARLPL